VQHGGFGRLGQCPQRFCARQIPQNLLGVWTCPSAVAYKPNTAVRPLASDARWRASFGGGERAAVEAVAETNLPRAALQATLETVSGSSASSMRPACG
jgi:hypothetical protein